MRSAMEMKDSLLSQTRSRTQPTRPRRKPNPSDELKEQLTLLLKDLSLPNEQIESLQREIPTKWERHGDLILLGDRAFVDPTWALLGDKTYAVVCQVLRAERLAKRRVIQSDGFRTPQVELLKGKDGWVTHIDNRIKYSWDLSRCMFSAGNITEKLRIAQMDCKGETVLDLYAGIGYFTLPYLVHAQANWVHACEWNPASVIALKHNLKQNGVENQCTIHEGDNRQLGLENVADRVNLGLLPSSETGWPVACKALKRSGGVLHVHANVDNLSKPSLVVEPDAAHRISYRHAEWRAWVCSTIKSIQEMLEKLKGGAWSVVPLHLEYVKSYAPRVSHLVLDLQCINTSSNDHKSNIQKVKLQNCERWVLL